MLAETAEEQSTRHLPAIRSLPSGKAQPSPAPTIAAAMRQRPAGDLAGASLPRGRNSQRVYCHVLVVLLSWGGHLRFVLPWFAGTCHMRSSRLLCGCVIFVGIICVFAS